MKVILRSTWPSRISSSGKWFYQASLRALENEEEEEEGKRSADAFIFERFNPDCGLFRSVLLLPAIEWFERLQEIRDKVTSLFKSCRNWKDRLVLRKTLVF